MVVNHSPKKDCINIGEDSPPEPTLYQILYAINDARADMNNKLDTLANRINMIEKTTDDMKCSLHELTLKNTEMETNILANKKNCRELQSEINILKETTDRLWRKNNIVVFGIPENNFHQGSIVDLMQIILPESVPNLKFERIGKPDENSERPIRIYLPTAMHKKQALSNCHKLKGLDTFKKISVRPDMTKEQQLQRKTPVQTRSKSRAENQRLPATSSSNTYNSAGPPKKRSKPNGTDEAMDD